MTTTWWWHFLIALNKTDLNFAQYKSENPYNFCLMTALHMIFLEFWTSVKLVQWISCSMYERKAYLYSTTYNYLAWSLISFMTVTDSALGQKNRCFVMEIQLEPGFKRISGALPVKLEFSIIFALLCWQFFDKYVYANGGQKSSNKENSKSKVHSNLDIANRSVRPFLFTISNNSLYQM